jgi:hypothetical protein
VPFLQSEKFTNGLVLAMVPVAVTMGPTTEFAFMS